MKKTRIVIQSALPHAAYILALVAGLFAACGCGGPTAESANPADAILGDWEVKMTFGEREITSTLSFSQGPDGTLAGTWKSRRGESELSDIAFDDGRLTFSRKRTYRGQERTFEGHHQPGGCQRCPQTDDQTGAQPLAGRNIHHRSIIALSHRLSFRPDSNLVASR